MGEYMSWDFFLKCAKQLITVSDKLGDGWKIEGNQGIEGGAYLFKVDEIVLDNLQSSSSTATDESESASNWHLRSFTDNMNIPNNEDVIWERLKNTLLKAEYHVTYSISYGVPVLCFNSWKSDGTLLTLEEAWRIIHPLYKQKDMYAALTQMDHAVLHKPFLTLHPCSTGEFVSQFMEISKNPLITWLNSVGPAIHLNLPIKMLDLLDDI